ncbi:MAG: hypothetical protein ACR2Q3_16995 [Woeseiaceae bacterium]
MDDEKGVKVHWSFWFVGVVTLIWNLLGAVNFIVQLNPESITAYRETERAIIEGRPIWATIGFGLAVFGGVLGSLFLLLRKSVSYFFFLGSLVGVIVAQIHSLSLGLDFGSGEVLGIVVMPIVLAGFLVWYSKRSHTKRWII